MSAAAVCDRRGTRASSGPSVFHAGNLEVDVEARWSSLGGERLVLTHQEFEVLVLLLRGLNLIVPHVSICKSIWGSVGPRELKRLGVTISNLRDKMDGLSPYTIATVRSRGYGLVLGEPPNTVSACTIGMHNQHSARVTPMAG